MKLTALSLGVAVALAPVCAYPQGGGVSGGPVGVGTPPNQPAPLGGAATRRAPPNSPSPLGRVFHSEPNQGPGPSSDPKSCNESVCANSNAGG